MPVFQKLIQGALEKIAKSQEELSALQKAAAKKIELMEAAKPEYVAPEGGGFKLYHGSPFKFDEFDFEGNLLKGEGALAFGPGGYMSGSESLARHYARSLYQKHAGSGLSHRGIREALATDPKASAEFLRALTVQNLDNWERRAAGKPYATTGTVNPRSEQYRRMQAAGIKLRDDPPSWDPTRPGSLRDFLGERTIKAEGFDEYRRAAERAGLPIGSLKTRIGQGGVSPLEAVRQGRELRAAVASEPGLIRPKLSEKFEIDPRELAGLPRGKSIWELTAERNYERYGKPSSYADIRYGAPAGFNQRRANLNSTARVIEGRPGNSGYFASMASNGKGRVDLRDPRFAAPEEFSRRLYSLDSPYSVEEMFGYDLPISKNDPRVVGALAQVAEKYGFLDSLSPDLRGADFIRRLSTDRRQAAARMRAMKEAGVPAMYFLRDGPRQRGVPSVWDPRDHNFVIFDQDRLPPPDFEEFAKGGAV